MQCYGDKTSNCVCLLHATLIFPSSPTCSRYPCRRCEARCQKHEVTVNTAALIYLPPTKWSPHAYITVLQSLGRVSNLPTNLLLRVLTVPCRELWAVRTRQHCRVSQLLGKCGFHMLWLIHVMQSWPLPCMRLSILLLSRGHTENMAPIYTYEGMRRTTTCGAYCCFSLHIHHHVNWIQLLLWSPSNVLFELIMNSVSVWCMWTQKVIQQPTFLLFISSAYNFFF